MMWLWGLVRCTMRLGQRNGSRSASKRKGDANCESRRGLKSTRRRWTMQKTGPSKETLCESSVVGRSRLPHDGTHFQYKSQWDLVAENLTVQEAALARREEEATAEFETRRNAIANIDTRNEIP